MIVTALGSLNPVLSFAQTVVAGAGEFFFIAPGFGAVSAINVVVGNLFAAGLLGWGLRHIKDRKLRNTNTALCAGGILLVNAHAFQTRITAFSQHGEDAAFGAAMGLIFPTVAVVIFVGIKAYKLFDPVRGFTEKWKAHKTAEKKIEAAIRSGRKAVDALLNRAEIELDIEKEKAEEAIRNLRLIGVQLNRGLNKQISTEKTLFEYFKSLIKAFRDTNLEERKDGVYPDSFKVEPTDDFTSGEHEELKQYIAAIDEAEEFYHLLIANIATTKGHIKENHTPVFEEYKKWFLSVGSENGSNDTDFKLNYPTLNETKGNDDGHWRIGKRNEGESRGVDGIHIDSRGGGIYGNNLLEKSPVH